MAPPAAGGNPVLVHVVEVSGTDPGVPGLCWGFSLAPLGCVASPCPGRGDSAAWREPGAGVVPGAEGDVGVLGSLSLAHPRVAGAGTQMLPVFALASPVPVGRDGCPLPWGVPRRVMGARAARVGRGHLGVRSASGDSWVEGQAVPGGVTGSSLST